MSWHRHRSAPRNRPRFEYHVFSALLAVLAWSGALCGQETISPDATDRAMVETIRAAIEEQVRDKRLPALSIALIEDQRIVWAAGFGQENPERGIAANATTVYRVGSVSKLFTDIALMQWVEKGRLDLDAPVDQLLDDFHPRNRFDRPITLRQLTSHRSGLVRESPVGNYFDPDEPSLRETVLSLNETMLVYPPETRTKYSNAGVSVVGYALERLTGVPFEEAMRSSVLEPLEMSDSDFELTPENESRLARAVMWTHDGREFPAPVFRLGTAPAGNLYSNVIDLSRFVSAIFEQGRGRAGRILKAETLAAMLDPQFVDDPRARTFGVGFHLDELDGHRMIGHGGAVYGYSTQLHALPEQKLGVVIATSRDGANATLDRLSDFALRCLLAGRQQGEAPEWISTTPVEPERARQLDGLFVNRETGESLRLIERNGELLARKGSYRFRLGRDGEDLIADDVHQFGQRFTPAGPDRLQVGDESFERVADELPSPCPDRWQGLVGEFGWDHNTLFVFEEAGSLNCLIEWFYFYPLTELDDHTFAFPDHGLYHGEYLRFERDEHGTAQRVVAAEVAFERRRPEGVEGETFRIDPVRPLEELREEALAAEPPAENRDARRSELVEVVTLDPSIRLDIRYATTNNFMGGVFYREPRAFLQRPAAEALIRVQQKLQARGYGLLIHDAYRPWYVTRMFWDATPESMKIFVANPASGSRHNRGCAVDLTLCDVESGQPIPMGAGYDEFSPRSFPDYQVTDDRARWHRELLRDTMESEGFTIYEFEWWHFDYADWPRYAIENVTFDAIR